MTNRLDETQNNFTLLRLLLALMVVVGHFKLLSGTHYPRFPFNLADAAVDCFFVVSGFLIAGSYERSHGLWPFYVRRGFRLYPMYFCVVVLQVGIMLLLLPRGPFSELHSTLRYLAANMLLANFVQYDIGGVLAGLENPGINPSLWTLKIEIGFYLIVPLIYLGIRRWGWPVLVAIFAASVAFSLVATAMDSERLARQLPGQLQFFVVGIALYRHGGNLRVHPLVSVAIAVGFLALWTEFQPIPAGIRPLLVGAFVYTAALCMPVVPLKSDMSYSVYLVHGPLLQTLILLGLFQDNLFYLTGVVAVVLALSYITDRLVERPGIVMGQRLARRAGRRVAAVPRTA